MSQNNKPRKWLIILMGIVLFCGTGLAITYFNEDVGMNGALSKLFGFISGESVNQNVLAVCYSVGMALGVIGFFNPPFQGKKPGPMDVKFFEFEQSCSDYAKSKSGKKS